MKTKSDRQKAVFVYRVGQGQIRPPLGKRHGMIKRTTKFIRDASGTMILAASDAKIVKKYMPYDR